MSVRIVLWRRPTTVELDTANKKLLIVELIVLIGKLEDIESLLNRGEE